jgi:hypothetical protein
LHRCATRGLRMLDRFDVAARDAHVQPNTH